MSLSTRPIAYLSLLGVIAAGVAVVSCTKLDSPSVDSFTELSAVPLGDTRPLHKLGNVYLGGQPSAKDFQAFKELGVQVIINLRKVDETDWDEAAVVEELGLKYIHLPFQTEQELTDELYDEALRNLGREKAGGTLLHCGACVRVGAIWYAHRVLQEAVSPEQAEQEARAAGMRSQWLLESAQDYVDRRQKEK